MTFLKIRIQNKYYISQNKTRGLFGTWSWDMGDDFTLPDGRQTAVNLNSFESAHRDFAIHCKNNIHLFN